MQRHVLSQVPPLPGCAAYRPIGHAALRVAHRCTCAATQLSCQATPSLTRPNVLSTVPSVSARSDAEWIVALSSRDGGTSGTQVNAIRELGDFLRRTLAKGFAGQLTEEDLTDLVQDSLLRITDKIDTFEGRSRFTTWAAAIAVHVALSEVRRRKYRATSLAAAVEAGERALQPPAAPDAADAIHHRERSALLQEAIEAALTERQRVALMAELGGLPLMEVARRLGSQQGAVYKLLHDARKRLYAHFEARGLSARDLLFASEDSP